MNHNIFNIWVCTFYGENILEDIDNKPYSFITNYQKIGYKKHGILTVLKE